MIERGIAALGPAGSILERRVAAQLGAAGRWVTISPGSDVTHLTPAWTPRLGVKSYPPRNFTRLPEPLAYPDGGRRTAGGGGLTA